MVIKDSKRHERPVRVYFLPMQCQSQYGRTLFLRGFDDSSAEPLKRVDLKPAGGEKADYDEAWLQRLIMDKPSLLPVEQLEPAFAGLVPICTELPVASGFLDNLLATPSGNLALIECKLWRNVEARRKVIGQVIDYATEMSTWSYEKLELALSRTSSWGPAVNGQSLKLYDRVAASHEIDEAGFVDAVSKNLRLGRFLLLIVGDGIQEGVLKMGEYLRQHAGLHFTLGLIEIAFFRMPTGGLIAQPRIFARTTNIDRYVVTINDDRVALTVNKTLANPVQKTSITKEQFLEQLDLVFPGIKTHLNTFVEKLADYEVVPEYGPKSIVLRWQDGNAKSWNLGTIGSAGDLWTDYIFSRARELGVTSLAENYIQELASLVPGAFSRRGPGGNVMLAGEDSKSIKVDLLINDDERVAGWLKAIDGFQEAINHHAV